MAQWNTSIKVAVIPVNVDAQASTGVKFTWIPDYAGIIRDVTWLNSVAQAGTVSTAPILKFLYNTNTYAVFTGSTTNSANLNVLGTEYEPDSGATNLLPFFFKSGDKFEFEVDTAQSGGTANTPKGYFVVYYEIQPDGIHA